jgi:hypothetical protein
VNTLTTSKVLDLLEANLVSAALGTDLAGVVLFGAYFVVVVFILWRYGPRTFTLETARS